MAIELPDLLQRVIVHSESVAAATKDANALTRSVREVQATAAKKTEIKADTGDSKRKVDELGVEIARLSQDIKLGVNTSATGQARLLALKRELASLDTTAHVDVKTDKANLALAKLTKSLLDAKHASAFLPQLINGLKVPAITTAITLAASALGALAAGAIQVTAAVAPATLSIISLADAAIAAKTAASTFTFLTAAAEKSAVRLDKLKVGTKAFQAELAKVPPASRSFTLALLDMRKQLDAVRAAGQRAALPQFTQALKIGAPLIRQFKGGIVATATELGVLAKAAAAATNAPLFQSSFATDIKTNTTLIDRLGKSGIHLGSAFIIASAAASPLTTHLANAALAGSNAVQQFVTTRTATGQLAASFANAQIVLDALGHSLFNASIGFKNLFSQGAQSTNFINSIQSAAAKFRVFTESASGQNKIRQFFENANPVLHQTNLLIGALASGLAKLSADSSLAPLIAQIRLELLPAILQLAGGVGPRLGTAVVNLATAFIKLFNVLSFSPLLILINDMAKAAIAVAEFASKSNLLSVTVATFLALGVAVRGLLLASKVTGLSKLVNAIVDSGTAAKKTTGGLTGLIAGYRKIAPEAKVAESAANKFGGVLRSGNVYIIAAVAALSLVAIALGNHAKKAAESKARVEALTQALRDDNGVIADHVKLTAQQNLIDNGAADAAKRLGINLVTLRDAYLGNPAAIKAVQTATAAASAALPTYGNRLGSVAAAQGKTRDAVNTLTDALGAGNDEFGRAEKANALYAGFSQQATSATNDAWNMQKVLAAQLAQTTAATNNASAAIQAFRSSTQHFGDGAVSFARAMANMRKAFIDLQHTREAGKTQTDNEREALFRYRDSVLAAANAVTGTGIVAQAKMVDILAKGRTALIQQAQAQGLSHDAAVKQVDAIIHVSDALKGVPNLTAAQVRVNISGAMNDAEAVTRRLHQLDKTKTTPKVQAEITDLLSKAAEAKRTLLALGKQKPSPIVTVETAAAQFILDQIKTKLAALDNKTVHSTVQITESLVVGPVGKGGKGSSGRTPPGKAEGGPVNASTAYLVGEQGPEIFVPRTSGTVVPHNQTKAILAAHTGVGTAVQDLLKAGQALGAGLAVGLTAGVAGASAAALSLSGAVYSTFTKFFEVASPSKLMRQLGQFLVRGLINGIIVPASLTPLQQAIKDLRDKVINVFGAKVAKRTGLQEGADAQTAEIRALLVQRKKIRAEQKALDDSDEADNKAKQRSLARQLAITNKQIQDVQASRSKAEAEIAQLDKTAGVAKKSNRIAGVLDYIEGQNKKLAGLAKQQDAASAALANANTNLQNAIAARKSFQDQVTQSTLSFASVANFSGRTVDQTKLTAANDQLAAAQADVQAATTASANAQALYDAELNSTTTTVDRLNQRQADAAKAADALTAANGRLATAQGAVDTANAGEALSGQNIVDGLTTQLTAITNFANNIATLRARGLNDKSLQDIVSAGVSGGGDAAAALANSSDAIIGQVNDLQSQITTAADNLGTSTSSAFFDAGVAAAQGIVDGITANQAAIEDAMLAIAVAMSGAIKKALGIASPSKVMHALGQHAVDGLLNAVNDAVNRAKDAGRSLGNALTTGTQQAADGLALRIGSVTAPQLGSVPAPRATLSAQATTAAGDQVNFNGNVNVIDPLELARMVATVRRNAALLRKPV